MTGTRLPQVPMARLWSYNKPEWPYLHLDLRVVALSMWCQGFQPCWALSSMVLPCLSARSPWSVPWKAMLTMLFHPFSIVIEGFGRLFEGFGSSMDGFRS